MVEVDDLEDPWPRLPVMMCLWPSGSKSTWTLNNKTKAGESLAWEKDMRTRSNACTADVVLFQIEKACLTRLLSRLAKMESNRAAKPCRNYMIASAGH